MNRLPTHRRVQVVAALVEGCSVRATSRMTGVSKDTILKLLADLGSVCDEYQDTVLRGLRCRRVQCDEIWSFCYARDRNLPDHLRGVPGFGSIWTWWALDADSKLAITWHVGSRDQHSATVFMQDVADRIDSRLQLTTDGFHPYRWATTIAFRDAVDYAQLVKTYEGVAAAGSDVRYSQPRCTGTKVEVRLGFPDPEHISTSFIERANLTMRMQMRRFTRLTNGFSKKVENTWHSVALHFAYYNFCRVHETIKATPAMAATS